MKKLELIIGLVVVLAATALAGIGTVSVTTNETLVLPARTDRKWLILQNNSVNDIFVKIDSSTNALTVTNGIRIPGNGGNLSISADTGSNPSRNVVKAISAVGTNTLTYQDGNEN